MASGMDFWQLGFRFLILFWMTSIFDAVVLDWWMFTRTDLFGIWLMMYDDPVHTGKFPRKNSFLEYSVSFIRKWNIIWMGRWFISDV